MATFKTQYLAKEVHLWDFQGLSNVFQQSHENSWLHVTIENGVKFSEFENYRQSFEELPSKVISGLTILKFKRSLKYSERLIGCQDLPFRLFLLLEEFNGRVLIDIAKTHCWPKCPKTGSVKAAVYKINDVFDQLRIAHSCSVADHFIQLS